MHALELKNINVSFSARQVLNSISLQVNDGEIICLLGPSGGGKTTLLRTIAGFQTIEDGEVWIAGNKYSDNKVNVAVEKRRLGMVFQDYALFPHLTARENICFGIYQLAKPEQDQKIETLSELLDMKSFIDLYPHQLSGGQQQRVAIARAMAPEPKLLLLDEPFSSMDVELRELLARDLRRVFKTAGITVIMVSHNQHEAFAMADRIGLINGGSLQQLDSAFGLYHRPNNEFVADFIGEGVFLDAVVIDEHCVDTKLGLLKGNTQHGYKAGESVRVFVRPDDILHDDESEKTAVVIDKVFRGAEFLYTLAINGQEQVLSLVPSHHDHPVNEAIGIRLEIEHLVVFPAK
ncbi:ABC transporter ATP-binding protein [Aliikangiella coralliicola]|uniref:ABC transporter ATP-binding protein n=1 Tax=Aliikangiella coralliicola TaxID=2592383 RepID=A0A545UB01_9GAMM|nr:ABC transporter ATP-binding protein [Aliikangiella coralliicola]TQV86646.1 ABC transporter ATP-binding protein [Aliikangiella coralliicola]